MGDDMGEVGMSRSSTILSSSSISSRTWSGFRRESTMAIGLQLKLADGVRPVGVLHGWWAQSSWRWDAAEEVIDWQNNVCASWT